MRLMALLTFIFVWSVQVYSMEGVNDPFECLPGARPFAGIKIKGEAAEECRNNFESFRAIQKELREKIEEYKIVESYAREAIEVPSMAGCDVLHGIREWISKPANSSNTCTIGTMSGDRVLSVNLETLAEVFSVRLKKTITAQELSEQITNRREQAREYSLLSFFSQKILNFPQHELDNLSSWLSGSSGAMGYATPGISASLKCDVSLVRKLLQARAGRDITDEFASFVDAYSEKEERIRLKEDFDRYTNNTSCVGAECVAEEIFENGMLTTKQAFIKGYDISSPLMAARNNFLINLNAGAGDVSYKIYDGFVSSQSRNIERAIGEDDSTFANLSVTTIVNDLIWQDGKVLTTGDTVWALSTEKELRIYPPNTEGLSCPHHDYLFRGNNTPIHIACAGHMEVKNGKISKINRSSGSYHPTELQLILALNYFHNVGIVSDNLAFEGEYSTGYRTLADVLSIANMIELV